MRRAHLMAQMIATIPSQADRFYASERQRIELEFYQAQHAVQPPKQKGSYSERLQARFARKRAKRG